MSDENSRNIQIKCANEIIYVNSLNEAEQFSTRTIATFNGKVHCIILPLPTSSIPFA